MKNLVKLFEKKLSISKGNAIFRIVLIFAFLILSVMFFVSAVLIFPYEKKLPTVKKELPDANYEISFKNNKSEGSILVDKKLFYKTIKPNDAVFVSVDKNGYTTFFVNKWGMNFYYEEKLFVENFFTLSYEVAGVKLVDNFLILEITRKTGLMIVINIIIPFLIVCIFLLFSLKIMSRKIGYGYDQDGMFCEQFSSIFD